MNETDTSLRRALRLVFLPLAKLLLKNKIGLAPVVEELKLAYVQAAQSDHGRTGKPASVNMISTLTGMSRNHISNLISQIEKEPIPNNFGIPNESKILGKWFNSDEYLDDLGRPRLLELGPGDGTFYDLVAKSVRPDEVDACMQNLLSSEAIHRTKDDRLELTVRGYRISADLPRLLTIGLATLASTLNKNWGRPRNDGFCQRVAHSGQIGSQNIARIRRMSRERISDFIAEFDDVMCSSEVEGEQDLRNPEGQELAQIGVGAYYFELDA